MTAVAFKDSTLETLPQRFDFQLPDELIAHEPP